MSRLHKPRSGVALGGIGCGWFEILQDGTFANWCIFNNRPVARGAHFPFTAHSILFFLIRYQVEGHEPRIRLLQIEESHNAAAIEEHEFHYIFPWLDGVDRIRYDASFPFVKLTYGDAEMPLEVTLEAWSPFIPHDVVNSSLPGAYFDFTIRSHSQQPVEVTLLASMRNCVGYDVRQKLWTASAHSRANYRMIEMSCSGMDREHASFGTMGLASLHPDSHYWMGWGPVHPYYEQVIRHADLPDCDDTESRNGLDDKTSLCYARYPCYSTIGRSVSLTSKNATLKHSFIATWDFPNRYARVPGDRDHGPAGYLEQQNINSAATSGVLPHIEGHYYSNQFKSASSVAAYLVDNKDRLFHETRFFHDSFFESSLPSQLLDQVNSHLNTFRTSTWLTRTGNFGILEGLSPTQSFAGLWTTDVAMYGGISTAALFPELEHAAIRAQIQTQNGDGTVLHSIMQNYRVADQSEATGLRLDLPCQFAFMALRAALYSGNDDFLREVWGPVKKALRYVLRERDFNGDLLPDMEGIMCSYDNFPMFGAAPYVATQWLAAISIALVAANKLDDVPAAEQFSHILKHGGAALEAAAWNGHYYRLSAGAKPDEGCLTDQIVGHWACHTAGLPGFLDPGRVQEVLRQILRRNFKRGFGLINCSWPGDTFLHDLGDECWVDQANTCWSGVELAFASLLIFEGMVDEGMEVALTVDRRYRKSGMYWDHQEFGGHYFRPMSAWAIIPAALGFSLSDHMVTFDPRIRDEDLCLFFATPEGYGKYEAKGGKITINLLRGRIQIRKFRLRAESDWAVSADSVFLQTGTMSFADGFLVLDFPDVTDFFQGQQFGVFGQVNELTVAGTLVASN